MSKKKRFNKIKEKATSNDLTYITTDIHAWLLDDPTEKQLVAVLLMLAYSKDDVSKANDELWKERGDLKEALSDAQKECRELRQTIQVLDQKGKEGLP